MCLVQSLSLNWLGLFYMFFKKKLINAFNYQQKVYIRVIKLFIMKVYDMGLGSITNTIALHYNDPEPKVGMGATYYSWSDSYPYTIVEVCSSKKIVVQEDFWKRIDKNGLSESQEYEYSPNPNGELITLTLRKNGVWVAQGGSMTRGRKFSLGYRRAYRDPHF